MKISHDELSLILRALNNAEYDTDEEWELHEKLVEKLTLQYDGVTSDD